MLASKKGTGDLDFPDNVEQLQAEERSIRLIGTALYRGFHDDRDFRDVLNPLISAMATRCRSHASTRNDHFQDAFNSYIVSAYHAARSAEALARLAQEYRADLVQYCLLMSVQHSFGPAAVFELQNAADLLSIPKIRECISLTGESVSELFTRHFPDLRQARHALAHEAERSMGLVRNQPIGLGLPQMRGQFGSKLFGLTTEKFEPLEIDISSVKIVDFLKDLQGMLNAAEASGWP